MSISIPIDELDVEVRGGMLAAFQFGEQPAGAPLVVAVHGITGNSRAWLPVARALDERARVVALDLRGRGASNGLPPPYGMHEHVADVLAVLDHLDAEQVVLVGHSLGAYVVTHFAVAHPSRVHTAVLVDGGLAIPGSEGVDPQEFADAFLGPAIARLKLTFTSREEYRGWWRKHPAFRDGDITDDDLDAYADHDLVGSEPALRSSVAEPAVRADAGELAEFGRAAPLLTVRAHLLCAPRGLLDDPNPMQPIEQARTWAAQDPQRRTATLVADVNHYTITLGAAGASAVARTIAAYLPD
jgi:pimeloyl-ACP methyl ester carboxylesterase